MIEENDIPKYKKKSLKKPPKKSDHKHRYEECGLEIPKYWYVYNHPNKTDVECLRGRYCIVCGKIEDIWWFSEPIVKSPIFRISSPYIKYVEIEKRES